MPNWASYTLDTTGDKPDLDQFTQHMLDLITDRTDNHCRLHDSKLWDRTRD